MHQTFDRKVPLMEQRIRVADMKQPGRKHGDGRGSRVKEARKASAKRNAKLIAIRHRKYRDAVRAYWLGKSECHP